jgi:recombinational DNA repair protein (RecF pathway)
MSHCAGCGCDGPFYGFSPSLGGIVCEPCAGMGTTACFALSGGAVSTLRTLLANPLAEIEGYELDGRAMTEVEQVVAQTLAYHGH